MILQHRTGLDNFFQIPIGAQDFWASDNFSNAGDFLGSKLYSGPKSSTGSLNYGNRRNLDHQESNFVGNLTGETMSINSGSLALLMSNLGSQFEGNPLLDYPASDLLASRDYISHDYLNLYRTNMSQNSSPDLSEANGMDDFYLGNYLHNSPLTCGNLWNRKTLDTSGLYGDTNSELLQSCDIVMLAMSQNGSQYLQRILTRGNPEITNMIVEGVLESLFELMTDEYGHCVFQKLIVWCNDYQMKKIILSLISQNRLLINASLKTHGSHSIQMLIKLLKRSPLSTVVSSALASGFYTLMIHQTGRHVILQCLIHLDSRKNVLLYKAAINYCIELATHEVGCLSLKECIDCIGCKYRDILLNVISEHSVFLSQDPLGTFVVQHVLDLQNPVITEKICSRLQGYYVRLSFQKSGSHIIEKCLVSRGMRYVVNDLLDSDKLLQVSRDRFGNYVIQKALKITKYVNSVFYHYLLWALKPHLPNLEFHPTGKNVYNLIKGVVSVHGNKFDLKRSQFQ